MNEPRPASENKMGTMPVPKLLFTMSIPMVISMLVQALYNVVDSVFVAKLSVAAAVTIMLAGLLLFQFTPHILLELFRSENDSGDLLSIGVPALRIISLSFLFAGYAIVCSSVFQALGHGVLSLLVSAVRQLAVLLPVGFLLSRTVGLSAVWWAFPIAELFSLALSTVFLRRVYLREIKPLASRGSHPQS